MRRFLLPFILFITSLVAGHIYILYSAPSFIMGKAVAVLQSRGIPLHGFVLSPQSTPQNQTIVRPSPDLAYSVCLYDLSNKGSVLKIQTGAWLEYNSISFFDSRTNNFKSVRLPQDDNLTNLTLYPPTFKPDTINTNHIVSPTQTGILIIRRLASTPSEYEKVKLASLNDQCTLQNK